MVSIFIYGGTRTDFYILSRFHTFLGLHIQNFGGHTLLGTLNGKYEPKQMLWVGKIKMVSISTLGGHGPNYGMNSGFHTFLGLHIQNFGGHTLLGTLNGKYECKQKLWAGKIKNNYNR